MMKKMLGLNKKKKRSGYDDDENDVNLTSLDGSSPLAAAGGGGSSSNKQWKGMDDSYEDKNHSSGDLIREQIAKDTSMTHLSELKQSANKNNDDDDEGEVIEYNESDEDDRAPKKPPKPAKFSHAKGYKPQEEALDDDNDEYNQQDNTLDDEDDNILSEPSDIPASSSAMSGDSVGETIPYTLSPSDQQLVKAFLKATSEFQSQLHSKVHKVVMFTLEVLDVLMSRGSFTVQFALSSKKIAKAMVELVKKGKKKGGIDNLEAYERSLCLIHDWGCRFSSSMDMKKGPGKPYVLVYRALQKKGQEFPHYDVVDRKKKSEALKRAESSEGSKPSSKDDNKTSNQQKRASSLSTSSHNSNSNNNINAYNSTGSNEERSKSPVFKGKAGQWKEALELLKELTQKPPNGEDKSARDVIRELIIILKKAETEILSMLTILEGDDVDEHGNNLETYLYLNDEIQIQKKRFSGAKQQVLQQRKAQEPSSLSTATTATTTADESSDPFANRGPRTSLLTHVPVPIPNSSLFANQNDDIQDIFATGTPSASVNASSAFLLPSSSSLTTGSDAAAAATAAISSSPFTTGGSHLHPQRSDLNFQSFQPSPSLPPMTIATSTPNAPRVSSMHARIPSTSSTLSVGSTNPYDSPAFAFPYTQSPSLQPGASSPAFATGVNTPRLIHRSSDVSLNPFDAPSGLQNLPPADSKPPRAAPMAPHTSSLTPSSLPPTPYAVGQSMQSTNETRKPAISSLGVPQHLRNNSASSTYSGYSQMAPSPGHYHNRSVSSNTFDDMLANLYAMNLQESSDAKTMSNYNNHAPFASPNTFPSDTYTSPNYQSTSETAFSAINSVAWTSTLNQHPTSNNGINNNNNSNDPFANLMGSMDTGIANKPKRAAPPPPSSSS